MSESLREDSRPNVRRFVVAAAAIAVLAAPSPVLASSYERGPNALYMGADILIARPVLLAMTAVGTALYVVSLPFSLMGGNAGEAGRVMVVGPARATFTRCLGCTSRERDDRGKPDG